MSRRKQSRARQRQLERELFGPEPPAARPTRQRRPGRTWTGSQADWDTLLARQTPGDCSFCGNRCWPAYGPWTCDMCGVTYPVVRGRPNVSDAAELKQHLQDRLRKSNELVGPDQVIAVSIDDDVASVHLGATTELSDHNAAYYLDEVELVEASARALDIRPAVEIELVEASARALDIRPAVEIELVDDERPGIDSYSRSWWIELPYIEALRGGRKRDAAIQVGRKAGLEDPGAFLSYLRRHTGFKEADVVRLERAVGKRGRDALGRISGLVWARYGVFLQAGMLNVDPPRQFGGYAIRAATAQDGPGKPWVLERDGTLISRHTSESAAWRRQRSLFGAPEGQRRPRGHRGRAAIDLGRVGRKMMDLGSVASAMGPADAIQLPEPNPYKKARYVLVVDGVAERAFYQPASVRNEASRKGAVVYRVEGGEAVGRRVDLATEDLPPKPVRQHVITWQGQTVPLPPKGARGYTGEAEFVLDDLSRFGHHSTAHHSVITNGRSRFYKWAGPIANLGPAGGKSFVTGWRPMGDTTSRPLSNGGMIYMMRELGGDWRQEDPPTGFEGRDRRLELRKALPWIRKTLADFDKAVLGGNQSKALKLGVAFREKMETIWGGHFGIVYLFPQLEEVLGYSDEVSWSRGGLVPVTIMGYPFEVELRGLASSNPGNIAVYSVPRKTATPISQTGYRSISGFHRGIAVGEDPSSYLHYVLLDEAAAIAAEKAGKRPLKMLRGEVKKTQQGAEKLTRLGILRGGEPTEIGRWLQGPGMPEHTVINTGSLFTASRAS